MSRDQKSMLIRSFGQCFHIYVWCFMMLLLLIRLTLKLIYAIKWKFFGSTLKKLRGPPVGRGPPVEEHCLKARLHIPFTHAFSALRCIFLLLTLVCWYLWIKKLLLQKHNAMRKTHAETGCGNSALQRSHGCNERSIWQERRNNRVQLSKNWKIRRRELRRPQNSRQSYNEYSSKNWLN